MEDIIREHQAGDQTTQQEGVGVTVRVYPQDLIGVLGHPGSALVPLFMAREQARATREPRTVREQLGKCANLASTALGPFGHPGEAIVGRQASGQGYLQRVALAIIDL